MAFINIAVAAKIWLDFGSISKEMIRGELNTINNVAVVYQDGTGQTLPSGTTLTAGSAGAGNLTTLKFPTGATFTGSGSVDAILTSTPGATVPDGILVYTIDGSNLEIAIDYNSRPTISDFNIPLNFAQVKTFTLDDFIDSSSGNYYDFDGDDLDAVMVDITGVSGFKYPNSTTNLQANTWIPKTDIVAGKLTYVSDSAQTSGYSLSVPYKVRDTHGLISVV